MVVTGPNSTSTTFPAQANLYPASTTQLTSDYYQYVVNVSGLEPGVSYQYQVVMDGQVIASDPVQNSFSTPTAQNFSFLAFGDSGAASPQQMSLIQSMAAERGISKVIHVGDLAYMAGTYAQFESNYFALNQSLMSRLPFFATPGNHEYETNSAAPYLAAHAAPDSNVPAVDAGRYYSFDWGDAHFASVDSNLLPLSDASARMLAWLDADLAASQKFWKIVFLHHPAYPTGTHLNDPICALVKQRVNPIVERHGVQLVLSGHEHGYERSYPLQADQRTDTSSPSTTYVITGGGGGMMEQVGLLPQCAVSLQAFHYMRVDVTGMTLTLSAVGLNGTILDQTTIAPPPAISPNSVLNAGDSSRGIAPGSLVSIFGQNLAMRTGTSSTFPLPSTMNQVSVTANGIAAPLLYVSPTQINVQIPYEVSGAVTIQVNTPNGSATSEITVTPTAPSIFAVVSGNGLNSPKNPAAPGGFVTVYVTGLGATSAPVPTGQAPSAAAPAVAPVQVLIGSSSVRPMYAGLTPGCAGVGQVNFQVPQNATAGTTSLRIGAGSAYSNSVSLNVQNQTDSTPSPGTAYAVFNPAGQLSIAAH